MIYLLILLAFTISALMSMIIIPRILVVALKKRLFDIPDSRKVHKEAIPRLGGLSFAPSILFSLSFVSALYCAEYMHGQQIPLWLLTHTLPVGLRGNLALPRRAERRSSGNALYKEVHGTACGSLAPAIVGTMDQQSLRVIRNTRTGIMDRYSAYYPRNCIYHQCHQPDRRNRRIGFRADWLGITRAWQSILD